MFATRVHATERTTLLQSRPMRHLWFIAVVAFYHACGTHNVSVTFHASEGHEFSREERQAIQTVADQTLREVRRALPALPQEIVLRVYASKRVIPETGDTGTAGQPNVVEWRVDPSRGVLSLVQTDLRPFLFYEFHG